MRVWECRHKRCGKPVFFYDVLLTDGVLLDARHALDTQGARRYVNGEPVWCDTCDKPVWCTPHYVEAVEHPIAPWELDTPTATAV